MKDVTDQMLVDEARRLDDDCRLILSSRQQMWLFDILFNDEGEPKPPQLTPSSRSFLESIYSGRYTEAAAGAA